MRTPRRPPAAPPQLPVPPARGRRAHAGAPAEEPAVREDGYAEDDRRPATAGGSEDGSDGGSRRNGRQPRLRPASVRAKVLSLLMVPVVSLLALWGFATVSTAQDIARVTRAQRVEEQIRTPVAAAVTELQAERRAAVRYLADPGSDQGAALEQQARRTDAAVRRLRLGDRYTVAESGDHRTDVVIRVGAFVAAAEGLGATRKDVAERRATQDAAYEAYAGVVDSALAVDGSLTGGTGAELGPEARVLLEFARAGELLSREDALISAPGPRTAETLRRLTGVIETRRALTAAVADDLPATQRAAWQSVAKSAAYAELTAAEDRVVTGGAATGTATGPAKDAIKEPTRDATRDAPKDAAKEATRGAPAGWDGAYASVSTSMREIGAAAHAGAVDRTDPLAQGMLSPAGAAVLLGLAAVAASLVISVRIGRALVVELVSLRNTALEIAHRKLPHAMDRLRAGQDIDVEAETPPPPAADDEITQVGEALATVHRAALGAAVERAELASGVSGVFVNLARRSQVLVHKQLTLLDTMERRADDPGELGDLFRLDHLTTRMRRHAESLIILSGAAPGRAWRMPVPLTNVVRAAVSEIEDYPRVEVRQLAEAAVLGGAVADLTHLLAELIENAAQFSPPHTKVRVSGEPVGAGYVLEVEDRGLGMGPESLREANRRIEQSEALDLFDSDRLGLFVVSRLSARHGVRVHLRTSPYGGTTAVVLLPNSLLQGAIETGFGPAPDPGGDAPYEASAQPREPRRPQEPQEPRQPRGPAPQPTPAVTVVREEARRSAVREEPRGITAPERSPVRAEEPRPAPVAPLRPRVPGGPAVTELPRRVRQASLVPQLREAPAPEDPAGARLPEDPPGRSPEQARDRMASYRAGWIRGAQESSAHAGSEGEV
ncbi:nitrate- and nitrite sensing domain-containing protein [Streptomyces sp. NPDC056485]|uniref:sensor histidine kinase n=1 Tax=Streptomyces sp. NPDC056485 TaxID=3345834 RepID=UPI0036A67641